MQAALRDITVNFGTLCAVDRVSLDFNAGEIHALVGENGAGKSTVMAVLFGMLQDYHGSIELDGSVRHWNSPRAAISAGIGMVHQHFMLQDSMTVLENVILGAEPTSKFGMVDYPTARNVVAALAQDAGLHIGLETPVARLSVGERQLVEILKLLYRRAQLFILDEPTAVLTPSERARLFDSLRQFREAGKTVILITHKIEEVMALADRVSVMRRGQLVSSNLLSETHRLAIEQAIIGGELPAAITRSKQPAGQPVLALKDFEVDAGFAQRSPLNLEVCQGEIVGIAGVAGNGQAQLVEAIAGLRPVVAGSLQIQGTAMTAASVGARRSAGLSYIPEDRQRVGLAMTASVAENAAVGRLAEPSFRRGPFLNLTAMRDHAAALIDKYTIAATGPQVAATTLSGGNQQKLVVARELSLATPLILVENPTWGVDIGAISFIHQQLAAMRDSAHAILLVSTDLDEILALADRIFVMFEGGLSAEVNAAAATREQLGRLMLAQPTALAAEAA